MEPKNLNEWWAEQPEGLKQAFTLFPDELWEGADLYLRINIRNYCCLKKDGLLPEGKERPMLIEIVSELADMELCRINGMTLDEMCDADRGFSGRISGTIQRIYDNWKGIYWII